MAFSGNAGTSIGRTVQDQERFCKGIAWSGLGASAVASINGGNVIPLSSTAAISPTLFSIGSARGGTTSNGNLWVRSLRYWPNRMSDAEFAVVTALQ